MTEHSQRLMECPVCSNKYSLSQIEEHVDRCLSLINFDENAKDKETKRSYPFVGDAAKDSLNKKRKVDSDAQSTSKIDDKNVKSSNVFSKTIKSSTSTPVNPNTQTKKDHVPLSELLRPTSLETYVGQKQLLGAKTVLGRLLKNGEITSMILWGPPGCGKTSLANVIAKSTKGNGNEKIRFVKLSAAASGIADIREAVSSAAKELKLGHRTILFMDEIHRFNKLQQDIFLPHVEAGTFILIGATTENPSFSLNSALLSRCRVFVLEKLTKDETIEILKRGILSLGGILLKSYKFSDKNFKTPEKYSPPADAKFLIDEEATQWLADSCNGDAGVALGCLEIVTRPRIYNEQGSLGSSRTIQPLKLGIEDLREGLERTNVLLDGKSDFKYDLVSAMQKSVRAGNSSACLYWLARLMACGEDPVYIARRLVRIASEDVGLADPEALDIAVHAMHACQMIGMPECDIMLSQCAIYMAKASKSRSVHDALRKAQKTIIEQKGPQPSVPLHIKCRGGEGKLEASLGAARIHLLREEEERGKSCLPPGLKNIDFFNHE